MGKKRSHSRRKKRNGRRGRNRSRSRGEKGRGRKGRGGRGFERERFGGREPRSSSRGRRRRKMDLEPFDMFCVYHLHITPDNRYKKKIRQREINGYFECSGDEFHDTLRRYGMDRKSVHRSGFDISLARLDMRVAPEGLDKRELARVLFDEFLEKNPGVRTFLGESGAAQTG